MPAERLWSLLQRFKTDWRFMAPVLVADLAGMAFGWYYYWDVGQFDPASPHYQHWAWWPLVADSPNAVLLFFVALLAFRILGWRSKWLDAGAFTLNIYVGLWTTMLFVSFPDRMGTYDWAGAGGCLTGDFSGCNANPLLFVTHIGMPLQAFILWPDMRRDDWSWGGRAAVLGGLALFVAVDYWGPLLHPAPFLHPDDALLHAGSPWLMVAAAAAWLAAVRPTVRSPQEKRSP